MKNFVIIKTIYCVWKMKKNKIKKTKINNLLEKENSKLKFLIKSNLIKII